MRLGILETLHARGRETLYPSRSLTAGSGNSDTAGANGVELTSTAVILTGARPTPRRRQVIIVTHNANLVINTDADQNSASWNQLTSWLRNLEGLRRVA